MAVIATRGRPGRPRLHRQEILWSWVMLSPWIFGFLIFTLGPMIVSLALSFTRYDVINPPEFVGLKNWALLFSDPLLLKSLQNTFFFAALHVPFAIAIALALALLLDQISRGAGFFRTVFYLPSITPAVATGILWLWLLNPQVGIVNQLLHLLHIPGPGWTTDPNWIKPGIVLMSLWGLGNTMVIYFAALRQVPNELYEAARVDGAKPWAQFFRITVPMISGTLFYTLVINTIFSLQYFTEVYTMFFRGQESGVSEDALFYVIYLFRQSFEYFHMGYASAMAWLLFAIIVVVTLVQVGFSRKFVHYEGEA